MAHQGIEKHISYPYVGSSSGGRISKAYQGYNRANVNVYDYGNNCCNNSIFTSYMQMMGTQVGYSVANTALNSIFSIGSQLLSGIFKGRG